MNTMHDEAVAEALPVQSKAPSGDSHDMPTHVVPTHVIEAKTGWAALRLYEIWEYRELLWLLVRRDLTVRYKQTVFGATWAVIQPIFTMIIFTVVFGNFARLKGDVGVPYPLFAFTALLPWNYFSRALGGVTGSMVGSGYLIKKVYFPRLLPPLQAVIGPFIDFLISFVVLIAMVIYFGVTPNWGGLLLLPLFLLYAAIAALSIGLWLTSINVKYRDIGHLLGHVTTIWMYATPVAYPISRVPKDWLFAYSLNPMVGVVEGFRWALLGSAPPDFRMMAVSGLALLVLLVGGLAFFKRTEREFADIV